MPVWVGPVASYLATGLRTTAMLAATSVLASIAVGVLLGTLLTWPNRLVRALVRTYVEVWRGLPIIIILFFVFFVLPIVGLTVDTFAAAAIGLSLWGSANVAEVVRGAVQSVPRGQAEAGAALGFPGRAGCVTSSCRRPPDVPCRRWSGWSSTSPSRPRWPP